MKKMTREEFVAHCVHYAENYHNKTYRKSALCKFEDNLTDSEEQLFTCPCCGDEVTFFELEFWAGENTAQDVLDGKIFCACCYENTMGEDL
jgi:hypothetical protein